MSRSRYCFGEHDRPHFLTCTAVEWLPVFTRQDAVQIVLDSWSHLTSKEGLHLYAYVIMENHLHAVAQAERLPYIWGRFKSYSARRILDLLEAFRAEPLLHGFAFARKSRRDNRDHQFWQEGSHPQIILDSDMLRQKIQYIHNNPVKRGYVDEPEHWRWSSARNYAGQDGLIDLWIGDRAGAPRHRATSRSLAFPISEGARGEICSQQKAGGTSACRRLCYSTLRITGPASPPSSGSSATCLDT